MARRLAPFDKNGRERATLTEKEIQTQKTLIIGHFAKWPMVSDDICTSDTNIKRSKMDNEQLSRKTVIIDGKEIDKEIVHHCMDTVEQAVLDVVTHLVKNGAEKEDVINAAKTTAEAIVVGMVFNLSGLASSK
ncbi:hypothetical protein [Arsenophonus endosymbiont of Crataerina pallida]|uniref:hypothetical protein n=1 Tax=Arsenophonus endosymbiont of Crataerina pallida TaxID=3066235 RepID=UPI0030D3A48C